MFTEIAQVSLTPKVKSVQSCTFIKTPAVFGHKPIKRLPQTNLIHKKKTKQTLLSPTSSMKKPNFFTYIINNSTKVKVTQNLKLHLDKITSIKPRCKIFRDLYQEKEFYENEVIFSHLYTLESEIPVKDVQKLKKDFEVVIISNKSLLVFNEDDICIDNDSLTIFNNQFPPILPSVTRSLTLVAPEISRIQLPLVSNKIRLFHSPSFKTVFTTRKSFNF